MVDVVFGSILLAVLYPSFEKTSTLPNNSISGNGNKENEIVNVPNPQPLSISLLIVNVCMVVSPLMTRLWLVYGTGNANYLFFQGFALWLLCAIGIIEWTKVLSVASGD